MTLPLQDINIGMGHTKITAALDACLVKDDAFTADVWTKLSDPFPTWGEAPTTQPALETAS